MDVVGLIYTGIGKIELLKLGHDYVPFLLLVASIFVYSEIYSRFIVKKSLKFHLIFLPVNLFIWAFIAMQLLISFHVINYLDISQATSSIARIIDGFAANILFIIGFAIVGMIADQVLHWILFGRGKSQFTLKASMSGMLLDEVIFRFLLFGILLALTSVEVAIFLQAVSYLIYYLDPLSSSRRHDANFNLAKGVLIGIIVVMYGWVFGLVSIYVCNFIWYVQSKGRQSKGD